MEDDSEEEELDQDEATPTTSIIAKQNQIRSNEAS